MHGGLGRIARLSLLVGVVLLGGCSAMDSSGAVDPTSPAPAAPGPGSDEPRPPGIGDGVGAAPPPAPTTAAPEPAPPTTSPVEEQQRQALLDRQHSFLRDGELLYQVPRPMRAGDWRRVVVRVSGTDPPPAFEQGFPVDGQFVTRDVQVGSDLVAALGGIGFDVHRVGDDDGRRTLAASSFAEWQWNVRALRSGSLHLDLVLYVRVRDGGAPTLVRTFSEQVQVQVNPRYSVARWLDDHWAETGLTVPVIVAAISAVAVWWRKRTSGSRQRDARRRRSGGRTWKLPRVRRTGTARAGPDRGRRRRRRGQMTAR